jgi:ribosomal protein S12 methylthiotransferase accessory factor
MAFALVNSSLLDLVDERVGIIKKLARLSKDRAEPPLPIIYQATLAHFDYRKSEASERMAAGKATTESTAMVSAIAEAVERYCGYQQRENAIVYASAATLDAPAIEPSQFVLYSERQYARANLPYRRPELRRPLSWVRGKVVGSGEEIYAPASLVYMNYIGAGGNEFFTAPTSNGLAAGPDLTSAVLAGLYELVERDAFVITWMNRLPVPRVDFSRLTGVAETICRHYARFGIETLVFNVTTNIPITVMMALTIDHSGTGPSVVVGLGCHLSPSLALEKALMELCQVRAAAVLRYRRSLPSQKLKSYEDVQKLEDHSGFAAIREHLNEFSFLLNSGSVQRIEDLRDHSSGDPVTDVEFCRESLGSTGSTVAYVDLTQPDVEPYGLRVVRSIATGLQPIHFGFGEERLGGQRLYTVSRIMGYRDRDASEDDLNRCPHPLA